MSIAMTAFDTLEYAHALKAAGFPAEQTEAQSRALAHALDAHGERLATQADLRTLEDKLDSRMDKLDSRMDKLEIRFNGDMQSLRDDVTHQIQYLKLMIGVVGLGVAAALPKLYFP